MIEHTLRIESITSMLIKHLMGISITHSTRSLDNKSSSLSLKSKIDILFDCKKIDKETYSALLQIMSIRNQFAHNYDCNNFEDLIKHIDGVEKFLLKYNTINSQNLEANLKNGFTSVSKIISSKLKIEFNKIILDYQKRKNQLERRLSKTHKEIFTKYKINGLKNKRIFLEKLKEIIAEESNKSEDFNEQVIQKITDFVNNNPHLLN
ncbi:MAG: hypothetical protein JNM71_07695 [Flavobacterium lindanitolerans]|uniref:hypothetical protein n=1 Tax=Flavobacterium lindanitolerans TaxID=428988 RepID=UPI001A5728B9|nr:hypothetical protein [Flavobacterium lindanitolerans]MBL7867890.1 hypothetical protein [Flavobacterium lindanitolerans]